MDRLLDGVHLSMIELQLEGHVAPLNTAALLKSWYEEQRLPSDPQWAELAIHWGIDPFSQIWSSGSTALLEHVFEASHLRQLQQLPSVTLFAAVIVLYTMLEQQMSRSCDACCLCGASSKV